MAVKVTVYGTADMRQIANARDELDKLEAAARTSAGGFVGSMARLQDSTAKIGDSLMSTGESLTKYLTLPLAAAGFALYKATDAAAEDAKQQAMLAQTMQNTANATKGQIAATEEWITAQGKAFGVADDQLRPALATLVTATGDVGKAQMLASTAMDVAAAKGVSVEQASNAIAKAYAGQGTALKKLIPGLDEAVLASGDFNAIQKMLADTVGGQAATAARTEAGERERANVAMSEAIESLGASFLPIMTQVTNFISTRVVPAVQQFADWFGKLDGGTKQLVVGLGALAAVAGPVLMGAGMMFKGISGLAGGITSVVGVTGKAIGGIQNLATGLTNANAAASAFATPMMKVGGAVASGAQAIAGFTVELAKNVAGMAVASARWVASTAVLIAHKVAVMASAVASGIATAAQWLWNIALTANPIGIIITAVAALVGALVWFFTQTDLGRQIWQGFVDALVNIWSGFTGWISAAVNAVVTWIGDNWMLLVGLLTGPIGLAIAWVVANWDTVSAWLMAALQSLMSFWSGIWQSIAGFFTGIWNGIVNGVRNGIDNVVGFFRGLNQSILNILSGAGRWLLDVGGDIVRGLWEGIKNGWTWLTDQIGNLVDGLVGGVKDMLGIKSPSRVFAEIGSNVSAGMTQGILAGAPAVSKALTGLTAIGTAAVAGVALSAGVSMGGNIGSGGGRSVVVAEGAVQITFNGAADTGSTQQVVEDAFAQLVRELRAQ